MRSFSAGVIAGMTLLLMAPAMADEPEKPLNDRAVRAGDVAATPVTDLNLKKDEIPALLLAAQEKPYDLTKLRRCPQIAAAIGELDAILGEDIDLEPAGAERLSVGRAAQSVVGSFIPFRSVIRELSGASEQQRKLVIAFQAGMTRRGFLKGYGQARGCRYPARSVTPLVLAQHEASKRAAEPAKK
jgi:hypothetical protein